MATQPKMWPTLLKGFHVIFHFDSLICQMSKAHLPSSSMIQCMKSKAAPVSRNMLYISMGWVRVVRALYRVCLNRSGQMFRLLFNVCMKVVFLIFYKLLLAYKYIYIYIFKLRGWLLVWFKNNVLFSKNRKSFLKICNTVLPLYLRIYFKNKVK